MKSALSQGLERRPKSGHFSSSSRLRPVRRTRNRARWLVVGCVLVVSACDSVASESLSALCDANPTDKCSHHHNYVELYETFFAPKRHEVTRLLEIGVQKGHSMRLWEDYFPTARIFGVDIVDSSQHDTGRITTFIADQASREQLGEFLLAHGSRFDIIIDDGGHRMDQQQISFGVLFPHLRSGGLYVIEDVHTSFPELRPGYGVDHGGANSTYSMIDRFNRKREFTSQYLSDAELEYLTTKVAHCLYSYRPNEFHSDFFLCYKL